MNAAVSNVAPVAAVLTLTRSGVSSETAVRVASGRTVTASTVSIAAVSVCAEHTLSNVPLFPILTIGCTLTVPVRARQRMSAARAMNRAPVRIETMVVCATVSRLTGETTCRGACDSPGQARTYPADGNQITVRHISRQPSSCRYTVRVSPAVALKLAAPASRNGLVFAGTLPVL